MIKIKVLVICFVFLISTALASTTSTVYEKNGNIYYQEGEKTTQLTSLNRDKEPKLHPQGEWIYFIRSYEGTFVHEKYYPPKGKQVEPGPLRDEIWRIKLDATNPTMLYQGKDSVIRGTDENYPVCGIFNLQFSPDGDMVYFETPEWVTSAGLHVMNPDGSGERLLGQGTNSKIILSAKTLDGQESNYRGYIVTSQHKYFLYGGSYDWFYLFTPDLKKEIGSLGDDPAWFNNAGMIKYTDGGEQ